MLIGATALLTLGALTGTSIESQAAPPLDINGIVNVAPAAFTPQFNNTVFAVTQVGNMMVVGGKFTNATQGGSTFNQPNVMVFNATTGAINTSFHPSLNGAVQAVEPGPIPNTVYVGGNFGTVNGAASKGLTLLNVGNGTVVSGWHTATIAGGIVNDIDTAGSRVYIGGTFTKVGGQVRKGLATLNATSGAQDPFVNLAFTVNHNWTSAGGGAKAPTGVSEMAISPDGTSLVAVGNFKDVNGSARDQAVRIDLTGPSAAVDQDWATHRFEPACFGWAFDSYIRDVNWSPDGSYFAIVATGGPNHGTLCDTVTRWNAGDTGTSVEPVWTDDAGGDTLSTVAVTSSAVYVGGHQRWLNNENGADSPGAGSVPRPGLGAVDPLNGVPLSWNPGRNPRGVAVFSMYAGTGGLWMGYNTDYIGNRKYKRQKLAFFPTAGGTTPPAGLTPTLPGDLYLGGSLPGANSNILYRVNTGGPEIGAIDNGPDWAADQNFDNPPLRNSGSNTAGYNAGETTFATGTYAPAATTPNAIYDSERWDPGDGDEMHWTFPVPNGDHLTVRLYFANRYDGTANEGERVFNVDLEGVRILDHLDLSHQFGHKVGMMSETNIVSDGTVNIDLGHVVENPLINGIEIIDNDKPVPPNTDAGLRQRAFDGTTAGPEIDTPDGGIDWSVVRGAVQIDNTLFYAKATGMLYRRTFNGTTFGTETAVDPYNDPVWSNVDTGSGQTFRGVVPNWYAQLGSLTGLTFRAGFLYYTLSGDSTLYKRAFSPESGIVGPNATTVNGVSLPGAIELVLSGNNLYTVSKATGDLSVRAWNNGSPDTSSTVVSGPSVDGIDWRARSLFAGP